jgi:hypothetical protein
MGSVSSSLQVSSFPLSIFLGTDVSKYMLSFLVDENQHRLFRLCKKTMSVPNARKLIDDSWKLAYGLPLNFNVPSDPGSFRHLCHALQNGFLRTSMKRLFHGYPKLDPNVIVKLLAANKRNVSVHETPLWYVPRSDLCELKDGDMANGKESWILEVLYMGSSIVLRTALSVLSERMYRYPGSNFTAISKWMIYMISATEDVGLIKLFFEFGLIQRMDCKHYTNLLAVTDTHPELFQTMIDHPWIKLQFQRSDNNLSSMLESIRNGASRLVLPWLTKRFILNKDTDTYCRFLFEWMFTLTGLRYCDESNIDSILQIMLHILSVDVDSANFQCQKETISKIRRSIRLNIRDPTIATRFYLVLKLLS